MRVPVRAQRRQDRERMVRRAWIQLDWQGWSLGDPEGLLRAARLRADNRKTCSCYMCSNKRRGWESPRTRQELLQDLELREWITREE